MYMPRSIYVFATPEGVCVTHHHIHMKKVCKQGRSGGNIPIHRKVSNAVQTMIIDQICASMDMPSHTRFRTTPHDILDDILKQIFHQIPSLATEKENFMTEMNHAFDRCLMQEKGLPSPQSHPLFCSG